MRIFYPLISAVIANIAAQALKPLFHYIKTGEKNMGMIVESGGLPSSHTSMVVALTVSIALSEGFDSTAFFISAVFSLITIYDAANVRYYAGQNIAITKQLISDFETMTQHKLSDPIYLMKVKSVLGHKWIEVFSGFILGIVIAIIFNIIL